MNKKTLFLVPLLLFNLTSCSINLISVSGDVITKTYTFEENINSLEIENIVLQFSLPDVNLHAGDEKKVVLTYEESLVDEIKVSVNQEELYIHGKENAQYLSKGITIDIYGYLFDELELSSCDVTCAEGVLNTTLTSIDLSAASSFLMNTYEISNLDLEVSAASSFKAESLKCDSLEILATGASGVKINDLETSYLECEVLGASHVSVSGKATEIKLDVKGASDFKGVSNYLIIEEGTILVEGASDCYLYVNKSLKGKVEGASDLTYDGPGEIYVTATGASDIKKK